MQKKNFFSALFGGGKMKAYDKGSNVNPTHIGQLGDTTQSQSKTLTSQTLRRNSSSKKISSTSKPLSETNQKQLDTEYHNNSSNLNHSSSINTNINSHTGGPPGTRTTHSSSFP